MAAPHQGALTLHNISGLWPPRRCRGIWRRRLSTLAARRGGCAPSQPCRCCPNQLFNSAVHVRSIEYEMVYMTRHQSVQRLSHPSVAVTVSNQIVLCIRQVCTASGLLAVGHQQGDVRLFQFSSRGHDVCQASLTYVHTVTNVHVSARQHTSISEAPCGHDVCQACLQQSHKVTDLHVPEHQCSVVPVLLMRPCHVPGKFQISA